MSPGGPGATDPRPGPLAIASLVCVYALPVVGALRPVIDVDVWYHLAYGRWMAAHRAVPLEDPFGAWTAGRPAIAYTWAFDLLVYAIHGALGVHGVVLLTAALGLLVAGALWRLVRGTGATPVWASLATAAALFAMLPVLAQPRPWLLSILLFVLELDLLLRARRTGDLRPLRRLPVLFLAWAQVHIQFVHGLLVLGLFALEPAVVRPRAARALPAVARRAAWLLACLAATLVNPYGAGLYRAVLENALLSDAYRMVRELRPPDFTGPFDWMALLLLLGAAWRLGRRPLEPFPAALLVAGALFWSRAHRDVWLLAVPAAAALGDLRVAMREVSLGVARRAIVAAGVLILAAVGWAANLGSGQAAATIVREFPAAAAALIRQRGYPGPVYVHYDWGSFLMWELPGVRVGMDGRMPLQGEARVRRSLDTWSGAPGWERDPELRASALVVGRRGEALTTLLRGDDAFCPIYDDGVAVVFVARGSGSSRGPC